MPFTAPQSSHGALLAFEADPDLNPGVYTTVAGLIGNVAPPALSRGWTELNPHNDDIDSGVSGPLRRGELSFSVYLVFDDATHSFGAGLASLIVNKVRRKFQILRPGGVAGDGETIFAGEVVEFAEQLPEGDNVATADIKIRATGGFTVNGVAYFGGAAV